ncbi:MAG: ABC transporter substrate-binding protein [Pseudomonadota bacterium]|nr:ABC transporter substrate-binding protein [Pseudomonadota bacterium]
MITCLALRADIPVAIGMAFTGPIQSLTPSMANAAELAIKQANESGLFRGGERIVAQKVDTTCHDADKAVSHMRQAFQTKPFQFMIGPNCSGVVRALLKSVLKPYQILAISPSVTLPIWSVSAEGLLFRTVPSEDRIAELMIDKLKQSGHNKISVVTMNNGYGKAWAQALDHHASLQGLIVSQSYGYEDDGDQAVQNTLQALSKDHAEVLVIVGSVDRNGVNILSELLKKGQYQTIVLSDGMIDDALYKKVTPALLDQSQVWAWVPVMAGNHDAMTRFSKIFNQANAPYVAESYDASALLILGMAKATSLTPHHVAQALFELTQGEGEAIYPGEMAKGLAAINAGKPIHYRGVTDVSFKSSKSGDIKGRYQLVEAKSSGFVKS